MHVVVDTWKQPLSRSFQVSHLTTETVDIVRLQLHETDGEITGEGQISADAGYDQHAVTIAEEARAVAGALIGDGAGTEPADLEVRLGELTPTVSAPARMVVEMAFLDRIARNRAQPVWRVLGLPEPGEIRLLHTVPIGERLPDRGPLKVKLGGPDDVAVLRRLVGMRGPIILDVNRGWSSRDWEAVRPWVMRVAPAVLEDPVSDLELLASMRNDLPGTAVILDEGIGDQASVEFATEVAGGANVKVMKLGGLFPARRALAHLTRTHCTRMLGCFLEPPRAIAYAAQLAGMCDWTDLDGHFWLSPEPAVSAFRLDSAVPGIPRIVG